MSKEYPAFCVSIAKAGILHLSPAQEKTMRAYLLQKDGMYVRMTYSAPTKTRSTNQNRYYWGVVLTMIASETGHTTEEIHEFFKSMFLPRSFLKLGDKTQELTKSTTTLSTLDFEDYLDRIRSFAGAELSMTIPMPNECDLDYSLPTSTDA